MQTTETIETTEATGVSGAIATGSWIRACLTPLAVLILCVGGIYGVSKLPEKDKAAPAVDAPVVNVSVIEVQPVPELADAFTLKGSVEPWAVVPLSTEMAGRIERIAVREGQQIRLGQEMIFLERDLLAAAAAQAEAQAQFDRREADRMEAMRKRNPTVVTETELDRKASAATVSAAAATLAAARLRRCSIKAPPTCDIPGDPSGTAGVLNALPVKVGQLVQPGDLVAQIVDSRYLKIIIDVPERDVRYLKVGQTMLVEIEALDSRKVTGTVHFIMRTADPRTRTYHTEIKVPNPGDDIRAGMIVKVQVVRRMLHGAIVVPLQAVIPLEQGYEVFISDGKVARRREIALGRIFGRGSAVALPPGEGKVGLVPGDRLIVKDPRLVGDGQRIREVPDPAGLLPVLATQPIARRSGAGK